MVLQLAREHEVVITVEEGAVGGFGAQVLQALAEHGALDRGLKVRAMVLRIGSSTRTARRRCMPKQASMRMPSLPKAFAALGKDLTRAGNTSVRTRHARSPSTY